VRKHALGEVQDIIWSHIELTLQKFFRRSSPFTEIVRVKASVKEEFLEEKAAKYSLQPIALGLFSGVYDYNKVPWWAKRAMQAGRQKIEAAYKETQPGVYDTRDWDAIRTWAKELSQKVHR
jgi:menaquinone-dependent protoporphyrinogen IX oxidase